MWWPAGHGFSSLTRVILYPHAFVLPNPCQPKKSGGKSPRKSKRNVVEIGSFEGRPESAGGSSDPAVVKNDAAKRLQQSSWKDGDAAGMVLMGAAPAPTATSTSAQPVPPRSPAPAVAVPLTYERIRLVMATAPEGFGLGFKDRRVHKVKQGSVSERAGLMIDDVILTVQGEDVTQTDDATVLMKIRFVHTVFVMLIVEISFVTELI